MEDLDANLGAARESLLWRAMSWSLGIAIGMVFLKMGAYFITGSAAILSDAAEAIVHVVAVLFAALSQSGASLDEVLTQTTGLASSEALQTPDSYRIIPPVRLAPLPAWQRVLGTGCN